MSWHLPKPKSGFYARPFAYSTQATSDFLRYLGEDGLTFHEALNEIFYDADATIIVRTFIHNGYGDHKMSEFIR